MDAAHASPLARRRPSYSSSGVMAEHHISSILISARPDAAAAVADAVTALPNAEVRLVDRGRIVALLEGSTREEIGARLTEIALMEGVLAANLVFEHVESLDVMGESV